MSNSALVAYTRLSPNHSGARNHAIDTITPHYVCGNCTVETLGEVFANTSRRASSTYGVGSDGRVGMYVEESNRAWTSGSAANDNRAVTIECSNLANGSLTDACWSSLVALCADICRRNGKTRLVYRGRADYSGLSSADMLLTKHCWFQDTDCPGPWLTNQFARLASEVNERLGQNTTRVSIADVAARIHYDMVTDERNGYSQSPNRWGGDYGGTKALTVCGRQYTYKLGSYDCSSSVITAWRLAIKGTPYEGKLDAATYTGDMRRVFLESGLFTASLTPAKRGDLYLAEGKHVAMCQDGGSDGVLGYDALSEFNMNEMGTATGGRPGDQTGRESVVRGYYDDGWGTVLHYNGKADYDMATKTPKQVAGNPRNNAGIKYQAHVQGVGWCPEARDGQTAGTTGYGKRLEAIRFTGIPAGWTLWARLHISNVGWVTYEVKKGATIGTTGKNRAIECMMLGVKSRPSGDRRKLHFKVHQASTGWKGDTLEGYASGTDGMGIQLEAVQVWIK